MNKPVILIPPGDPSGIGPEVALRALMQEPSIFSLCVPVLVCDPAVLCDARLGMSLPEIRVLSAIEDARSDTGNICVLPGAHIAYEDYAPGRLSPAAAGAAVAWVREAASLVMKDRAAAVVTGPLNKEAMRAAGIRFIGHTELLADAAGVAGCTTMLATPGLRVTHVTRHIPFKDIADTLSSELIMQTVEITHKGLEQMGVAKPRLAVAGLNPHNGDNGLLGCEEAEIIAPAVRAARAAGIGVAGPVPADSVFFQAINGDFDAVVCLYHDQGHIAVKTHDFRRSITITLGLPFLRTSVDHGTAFEIAGKSCADAASMTEAILQAAEYASGWE